jgi:predicted GNAT family acetyltransferase
MAAPITCKQFDDSEAFLRHAGPLLRKHAIDNNVMLGIIRGLRSEPQDSALMLGIERGERPCLAAVMTPPYRLLVSQGDATAVPSLVARVVEIGVPVSGVLGLVEMAQAFAGEWQRATGQSVTPGVEMTLYATRQAILPDGIPGRLRATTEADAQWVSEAYADFTEEIFASEEERRTSRDTAVKMLRRGLVFLWELGGAPVSMACFRYVTDDGVRIAPVFTPPAERGKGYASACVGHLTRQLLHGGVAWCSLFADVADPMANRLYRRLGYEEAVSYRHYDFGPATHEGMEAQAP